MTTCYNYLQEDEWTRVIGEQKIVGLHLPHIDEAFVAKADLRNLHFLVIGSFGVDGCLNTTL